MFLFFYFILMDRVIVDIKHNISSFNEATIILIIVVNIMGTMHGVWVIVGVNCPGGNNYGCEICIANTSNYSFFHFRSPQL